MITPLEIQNKEFSKAVIGYSAKDVDGFLDDVIVNYERVYKENIELKDKINMMADQLRKYNAMEETLKETLIVAQTTADEVTSSARQKAENIVDEAELTGQKVKNQAHEDVRNIKREYEELRREIYMAKARYQSFLQSQLISIEDYYKFEGEKDLHSNQEPNQEMVELEKAEELQIKED